MSAWETRRGVYFSKVVCCPTTMYFFSNSFQIVTAFVFNWVNTIKSLQANKKDSRCTMRSIKHKNCANSWQMLTLFFLLIQGYMGKVYRKRLCEERYEQANCTGNWQLRLMTVRTCEKCERSKTWFGCTCSTKGQWLWQNTYWRL